MSYSNGQFQALFGIDEGFLLNLADSAMKQAQEMFEAQEAPTTSPRPTIYIAGPMRNKPNFNFDAFMEAEEFLTELGWDVFSPANNDLDEGFDPWGMTGFESLEEREFDLIAALKWDMNAVLDADAIYMLPDWENSMGATAEYNLAKAAGKTIYFDEGAYEPGVETIKLLSEPEEEIPPFGAALSYSVEDLASVFDSFQNRTGYLVQHDGPIEDMKVGDSVTVIPVTANEKGEIRTTSSTGGEKGVKPERHDLIPVEAMAQVAIVYGLGAQKYSAHNWRKGYEWSKSYASLQRHLQAFWGGEDLDPEFGTPHMAHVVFHALTLLTFMQEQRDFDDRFKKESN